MLFSEFHILFNNIYNEDHMHQKFSSLLKCGLALREDGGPMSLAAFKMPCVTGLVT